MIAILERKKRYGRKKGIENILEENISEKKRKYDDRKSRVPNRI